MKVNKSPLAQANEAFRNKDFNNALRLYIAAQKLYPELKSIIDKNIENTHKHIGVSAPHHPVTSKTSIDIVVPVFNALEDVKKCLASLSESTDGFNVKVIVVNDGSDEQTTLWLQQFCNKNAIFTLIENSKNLGYTKTVNVGLKASSAEYVITQNSDTIVCKGWLIGLVNCMKSDSKIGVCGPLSNAATWQNVPNLYDDSGKYAVNDLPKDFTVAQMAEVVSKASLKNYPRLPFVNGFCFMIKREVTNKIGYMDEENFPVGYGEENDYCIRALDAGYELAIADDIYVYHAKSKSFGHEKRKDLSGKGTESLVRKHSAERYTQLLNEAKNTAVLDEVRHRIKNELTRDRQFTNLVISQNELKYPDFENILAAQLIGSPQREFKSFDFNKEKRLAESFLQKSELIKRSELINVSIVMPTYNRGLIIGNAIQSILAQTHKNWELLIVDDGSTDNTIDILKHYTLDTRIRVIQGDHQGVSAARNKALKQVSGSYVFYLDSDNTWTSQYLKQMIMFFLYSRRKTGYSAISIVDDSSNVIGYRGEPFDWEQCLESNYVDLNAFAHESILLKEYGVFDETLRRMVDWDLILRYTKNNKPFYLPIIGCNYLQSKNDSIRITLSEPMLFQKVVRLKNSLISNSSGDIVKSLKLKIAIKIPARYENRHEWGDFHYADSLRCAFEKMGHEVNLDFYGKWNDRPANQVDVVLVIRGLHSYKPVSGPINILWNISHPDQISFDEYEAFDLVYVASTSYASFLGTFLKTRVSPLMQCTDPNRFYYQKYNQLDGELLFVGNSRNEYRPIVKKAIDSDLNIDIYGTRWSQFVPTKNIRGENIPNQDLRNYYSKYEIVLNDHWESMRVFGFVSNRIFDVIASGGTLISDSMPSISGIFGNAVTQIDDTETLESAMLRARSQNISDLQRESWSKEISKNHSFESRAYKIYNGILSRIGLVDYNKNDCNFLPLGENQPQKNVIGLLLQNGPTNPTSSAYIRLISPLTSEEASASVSIVVLNDVYDPALVNCNSVVVQRVAVNNLESANYLITTTRQHSIKLYVDNDDAFTALPITHPESEKYRELDVVMRYIMQNADHVWFSTTYLADLYRNDWTRASVIPNSLDPRLWRNYRTAPPEPSLVPKFRILYMGTATHDADFSLVLPALDALFEIKGNSFEVVVIGALRNPPKRTWLEIIKPPLGKSLYPKFARWLASSSHFDIGIAPLVDNHFNSCKSDIKYLDYTALGIPTICSNSVAYHSVANLGLVLSCENSTDQWLQALKFSMENRELMLSMVRRSWDYLWQNRSSKTIALELLSDLSLPRLVDESSHITSKLVTKSPINNVAVCLHLYYTDQWKTIKSYLKNIEHSFDLYITCIQEEHAGVQKNVYREFPNATVVVTQNIGMDVLPFLQINHDFELWRYDAVLKIHTKNDKSEDGATIGKLYLESLLGSKDLVNTILDQLPSGSRVGMVGPEIMYRSASKLMYGNKDIVGQLFKILGLQYPNEDWGFFAGTMFWINGALLKNIALHFTEMKALAQHGEINATTGGDGTWAHAMERVLGFLPSCSLRNVAVTYICTSEGKHNQLRKLNSGELMKNPSFRNGSIAYLRRYSNLKAWCTICIKNRLFNEEFYKKQASALIPKQMDPIVHYILYGDCNLFDPGPEFSTSFYKKHNGDVVKARNPSLIHYISNGKKEGRRITSSDRT